MKKQFVKVPVGGMTAEEVLARWQRGELYQVEKKEVLSDDELLARCQQEALAYVAAIDEFATAEWQPHLHRLWEVIVADEFFAAEMVMKQNRRLNKYFVTSLVCNLQVRGVYYSTESVSLLKLHLTLEGITKKNSIYKNMVNYPVNVEQRKRLSTLMEDFLASLK